MREIAEVIEDKENSVLVKVDRASACSKCEKNCAISAAQEMEEIVVEVEKNSFNLNKGQKVVLQMQEENMVFSALIVYLLPLIFMITGYFITNWFIGYLPFNLSENYGIIGSGGFLTISFYVIKKINNSLKSNRNFQPQIVSKLE
ncbi:MAG: SoxR reducing system RseC family protein [Halanaerobiales bacterium]